MNPVKKSAILIPRTNNKDGLNKDGVLQKAMMISKLRDVVKKANPKFNA